MVKPLTVYKASAGSGKTFALAVQYIKLVVQNPQAYRNILAVTFTNKATEEMKTRILSQLYGIWKQLPDSDVYLREVCHALDASPQFVSQRAGIALSLLLHNYNHFRVMTIDTFFQSVLRNLARELDLTTNLHIGLNDVQIEEQAVDEMIEDLKTTDAMLLWIMRYIMENISDDRSWNIIGQIKQFGKAIFQDNYKDISRELSQRLQQEDFFDRYTATLRDLRDQAKEHMLSIAESFFGTLEEEGLGIDDLANKRRGIASFFLKLRDGIFDPSIENATVANCLGNPEKWYTKTHPRRQLIHALAEGQLGNILRYAVEVRPRQWKLYQSAVLTLRHLNQVRLLSSIESKVRAINADDNRFLLSDTQKLLSALISEQDAPFVFEKIGTQLQHVMIDEFQDTSTVQWHNFQVLLAETMSHKGSENLIVGDVKQSIYRWRNGDWRLLFSSEMVHTEPLKTNRRSDRRVITFNNTFFTKAAQAEYDRLQDQPGADQLKRAYQDVEQLIPDDKSDSGFVHVELLPADDYQQATLQRLADTVSQLLRQGVTQSQMAILVRINSYIPLIANYFSQHLPEVSIVSDEAFRLDASQSVKAIIQALKLIRDPGDQLARAFLQKYCGDVTIDGSEYARLSLYELVEQLFADLRLDRFDEQSAYVCTFFDHLRRYASENPATIDGLLTLWESELHKKTIQSDIADGVRIISIHKSKGLEYDVVLSPFCDWPLEKSGNVLWCRPAEEPFSELPIAPIDYSQKGMLGSIYERDYHHEHLQNVVDNLNLLYVDFTRARRALYVLGKRGSKNSRSEIIEQVITTWHDAPGQCGDARLTGKDTAETPLILEYGDEDTTLAQCAAPKAARTTTTTANPFVQPSVPVPVVIDTHRVTATFRQSNRSRDFIAGDDEQASTADYIQLGNILHGIFSTIRTTDDIGQALRQLEQEGVVYSGEISLQRIQTLLRKRLENPIVAEWFSDRWTLFNECTILSPSDDGTIVERRPDRVMTDGTRWIVVDFKFGRPRPEYRDQVHEYMQLIESMGHTDVTGYLWYVYSNKIEQV